MVVNIAVTCTSPKRLAGEYSFSSFEELYSWMLEGSSDPRLANHPIIPIAERGECGAFLEEGV